MKVPVLLSIVVVILFLFSNFYQLFQMTHDTGLLLVVVSLLWVSLSAWEHSANNRLSILWGLWGGLITLSSPILGAAWIPWSNRSGEQMARYMSIGELPFVREKGALAKDSIVASPVDFMGRVLLRFEAALVYYRSFAPMDEYFASGWPILFARVMHPLPLIALAIVFGLSRAPMDLAIFRTAILFGVILAPYILISYYDRYGAITVGLTMLLVIYASSIGLRRGD